MEHLSDDELQSFFSLRAKPSVSAQVVRHLLSACESCQKRAATVMHELGLDTFFAEEVDEGTLFFEALPELLKVTDLIREELKQAKVSFTRLAGLPEKERLAAVRKYGRYKKYGLALYFLEMADAYLAKRKSGKAKELVLFSISMHEHLRERVYRARILSDLRLRQLSTLANIHRGEEDFNEALATLEEANNLRHVSTDPVEEARFLRVEAALLYDLGEFEVAAKAARESGEVYQLMGDDHSQAKEEDVVDERQRGRGPFDVRQDRRARTSTCSASLAPRWWSAARGRSPAGITLRTIRRLLRSITILCVIIFPVVRILFSDFTTNAPLCRAGGGECAQSIYLL